MTAHEFQLSANEQGSNHENLSPVLFLKDGALALASVGGLVLAGRPSCARRFLAPSLSAPVAERRYSICIFQRGAADGVSMVVPHGDPHYYEHRKEIALARPTRRSGAAGLLDLDGFFGLHPRAGAVLADLSVGPPGRHSRVRFTERDPLALRCPGLHGVRGDFLDKSVQTGWLNRALLACPEDRAKLTPFRAVAMTSTTPRCLQGEHDVLSIPDLRAFGVGAASLGQTPSQSAPERRRDLRASTKMPSAMCFMERAGNPSRPWRC